MNTNRTKSKKPPLILYFLLIIITTTVFINTQPRIKLSIIASTKQHQINQLITNTQTDNHLDLKKILAASGLY